jgi:hypothetical protein
MFFVRLTLLVFPNFNRPAGTSRDAGTADATAETQLSEATSGTSGMNNGTTRPQDEIGIGSGYQTQRHQRRQRENGGRRQKALLTDNAILCYICNNTPNVVYGKLC